MIFTHVIRKKEDASRTSERRNGHKGRRVIERRSSNAANLFSVPFNGRYFSFDATKTLRIYSSTKSLLWLFVYQTALLSRSYVALINGQREKERERERKRERERMKCV